MVGSRDGYALFNRDLVVLSYPHFSGVACVRMEMLPSSFTILVLGVILS